MGPCPWSSGWGCFLFFFFRSILPFFILAAVWITAEGDGEWILLNYGDSFSPPRMLQFTRRSGSSLFHRVIIPLLKHFCSFFFLLVFFSFLFFFFSVHPFRAVDTDSWQMSEIIIAVFFFFFLVIYHLPDRMSKALNFNFALFCSKANYACLSLRLP